MDKYLVRVQIGSTLQVQIHHETGTRVLKVPNSSPTLLNDHSKVKSFRRTDGINRKEEKTEERGSGIKSTFSVRRFSFPEI